MNAGRLIIFLFAFATPIFSKAQNPVSGVPGATKVTLIAKDVFANTSYENVGNNEYTWKIGLNSPLNCITQKGSKQTWYNKNVYIFSSQSSNVNSSLPISFEGFEDDCGGRCTYNASCTPVLEDDNGHCMESFMLNVLGTPPETLNDLSDVGFCSANWKVNFQFKYTVPVPQINQIKVNDVPYNNTIICGDPNIKLSVNTFTPVPGNVTITWYYHIKEDSMWYDYPNPNYCGNNPDCNGGGGGPVIMANTFNQQNAQALPGPNPPPSCCFENPIVTKRVPKWRLLTSITGATEYSFNLRSLIGAIPTTTGVRFYAVASIGGSASEASPMTGFINYAAEAPQLDGNQPSPIASCYQSSDGAILIKHSTIPAGYIYNYTIVQLIPGSNCQSLGYPMPAPPAGYCWGGISNATNSNGSNPFTIDNASLIDKSMKMFAGKYDVKVEAVGGRNVCFTTRSYQIPERGPLTGSLWFTTPPSCKGGNDGLAGFNVSGGSGSYSWQLFNAGASVPVESSSANFSNLTFAVNGANFFPGDYKLRINDNGCGQYIDVPFTLPNSANVYTVSIGKRDPWCYSSNGVGNGEIDVYAPLVSSYWSNYQISLFDNNTNQSLGSTTTGYNQTVTFSSLTHATTYLIKASSPNKCETSQVVNLTAPQLDGYIYATNNNCFNGNQGAVTYVREHASSNLNFLLDGSPVVPIQNGSFYTVTGLSNGSYKLKVIDNCLVHSGLADSKEFPFSISGPPAPMSYVNSDGNVYWVSCADGVATATGAVTAEVPPLAISISKNGGGYSNTLTSSPFTFTNLGVGTYKVKAEDGCANTPDIYLNFEVKSNATAPITALIEKPVLPNGFNLSCAESTNGSMQITVTGGVQGSTPKYKIDLLDANQNLITSNVNPPPANESLTNETVVGQSVKYDITGLKGGVAYKIRVTDFNTNPYACVKIFDNINGQPLILSAPALLTIASPDLNADFQNKVVYNSELYAQCKGNLLGYTAKVSGGNTPYVVTVNKNSVNTWPGSVFATQSTSSGSLQFSSLSAGYYQVTVADKNGCAYTPRYFQIKEATASIDVTQITASLFGHGANTSCYGSADASITVSGTGGVVPYTYSLQNDNGTPTVSIPNNPQNTYSFQSLPALKADNSAITYSISFTDVLGCQWQSDGTPGNQLQLISPSPVTFTSKVLSRTVGAYEIPCRGDDALIVFKSSGGLFPHTITLNDQSSLLYGPKQQIQNGDSVTFSLPANTYQTSLTDALGCTAMMQSIPLDEPATNVLLIINSITAPPCIGGNDGSIQVSATGGIPGSQGLEYIFSIRAASVSTFDADSVTAASATFFRPANEFTSKDYTARARDANGCVSNVNLAMPVTATPLSLTQNALISPSCYGATNGSIKVTASNYSMITGTYLKFKISGGHFANLVQTVQHPSDVYTFTNLQGTDLNGFGPYRVWVEDAHACVDTAFQFLPGLVLPSFEPINVSCPQHPIRPSCLNASDGSLSLKVTGGVTPYSFSRDGLNYQQIPGSTIAVPNLEAGLYSIYIRDANYDPLQPTCQETESFTVPSGRKIQVVSTIEQVSCKNGDDGAIQVDLDVENRSPGEIFDPTRLTSFWTRDNISPSLVFSTSEDLSGLSRGTYSIHLSYNLDSTKCELSKSLTVLEPYSSFKISDISTYSAPCGSTVGGKAVVNVSGGWASNVKQYRIDAGPWVPFYSTSFLLQDLSVGSHQVAVLEESNCIDERQFVIGSADLPLTLVSINAPSCPFGEDASLALTSTNSAASFTIDGIVYQSSPIFSGLKKGSYKLTARDVNNYQCASKTITVTVEDPADCGKGPLTASLIANSPSTCGKSSDGQAQVIASGGVPPYTFALDGGPSMTSGTFTQLQAGGHQVVISDLMNSKAVINFMTDSLESITAQSVSKAASCPDATDGGATLLVTGGSGNYLYYWSDGAATASIDFHRAGSYDFKVGDQRNQECFRTGTVLITSVEPITIVDDVVIPPSCPAGSDGKMSVKVWGGSGHYDYEWSNGEKTPAASGLKAGSYQLVAKDRLLGCVVSKQLLLNDPSGMQVTAAIVPTRCFGAADGKIVLTIKGSKAPLVQWSNGKIGNSIDHVLAGRYSYEIIAENGCSISGSLDVPDAVPLQITPSITQPKCFGSCDGQISLSIAGGAGPYFVSWSNGAFGLSAKNLCDGSFSSTVVDSNGCTLTQTSEIKSPTPISITGQIVQPTCQGSRNGSVTIAVTGGSGAYTYRWQDGKSSANLLGLPKGTYVVHVADANLCSATNSFLVEEPSLLQLVLQETLNPRCTDSNDGKIVVSAQGGTLPYDFKWHDGAGGLLRTNLPPALYPISVSDAKGCLQTRNVGLQSPAPLSIIGVNVTDPHCHDDSNGRIELSVIGGAGSYRYKWNTEAETRDLSQLKAGAYEIIIRDKNGCSVGQRFSLNNPVVTPIEGIPTEQSMCSGGKTILSPRGVWQSFVWDGPNGFTSNDQRIEARLAGIYHLAAVDSRNCLSRTNTTITISDDLLHADFLRISEAIEDEPIVFVDISVPVPERVEWLMPETSTGVTVISSEQNMIQLLFDEPGEYLIGMRATKETCESEQQKIVKVSPRDNKGETSNGRRKVSDEIELHVFPNPISEEVFIQISTIDNEPIEVRFISNLDQREYKSETLSGKNEYLIRWSIPEAKAGVYTLLVHNNRQSLSRRLIVIR